MKSAAWTPIGGAKAPAQPDLPADKFPQVNIAARTAFCAACAWNVNDRCQHPAQGCAPCKQGMGLQRSLALPWFHCPLGNFT